MLQIAVTIFLVGGTAWWFLSKAWFIIEGNNKSRCCNHQCATSDKDGDEVKEKVVKGSGPGHKKKKSSKEKK